MSRLAPQLVIFDCDGVLVDSEPISNEVLAHELTSAGLQTTPAEAIALYKGRILADVLAVAESRLGRSLPDGFGDRYERRRTLEFQRRLQPIEGAAEAVKRVRAAGIDVCVASQGKPEKTELTLGLTGLRPLFGDDALFSAYSVPRGKPYPDLFLYAAASMGAPPARCVVVEDTELGVRAATAAKMRVFAYVADADMAALRAAGAAAVLHRLADFPAAIGIDAGVGSQRG
jgi:HAD superfamily hydrolase (TIGR01509 family)